MTLRRFTLAAALISCFMSSAQADGIYIGGGYADLRDIAGAEIELGYRKSFDRVGLNISPLSGVWHKRKDGRYREETFNNGSTACRDTTNGQFADKENCDPEFDYALLASLDYAFTNTFRIGAGVRVAKKSSSFVAATVAVTPQVQLGLRGGSRYAAANVSFSF